LEFERTADGGGELLSEVNSLKVNPKLPDNDTFLSHTKSFNVRSYLLYETSILDTFETFYPNLCPKLVCVLCFFAKENVLAIHREFKLRKSHVVLYEYLNWSRSIMAFPKIPQLPSPHLPPLSLHSRIASTITNHQPSSHHLHSIINAAMLAASRPRQATMCVKGKRTPSEAEPGAQVPPCERVKGNPAAGQPIKHQAKYEVHRGCMHSHA
jgi:hypothetical protein